MLFAHLQAMTADSDACTPDSNLEHTDSPRATKATPTPAPTAYGLSFNEVFNEVGVSSVISLASISGILPQNVLGSFQQNEDPCGKLQKPEELDLIFREIQDEEEEKKRQERDRIEHIACQEAAEDSAQISVLTSWLSQESETHAHQVEEQQQEHLQQAGRDAHAAKVGEFLRQKGFSDVNSRRKSMFRWKLPLHAAVKAKDVEMISSLITCKADPLRKNSRGETPMQVAEKLNRKGSHSNVMAALQGHTPAMSCE